MNKVRQNVMELIPDYLEIAKYKDLIAFCVDADYLAETDHEADFNELIVIVEKEWLFNYMDESDPLKYLQEEYTSDDSIDLFDRAALEKKIVTYYFN